MSSKVYIEIDTSIFLLSTDKTLHTLFYIIQQINININEWEASKENKKELTSLLSTTASTLDKHLSSLRERGILERNKRGLYTLNHESLNIDY